MDVKEALKKLEIYNEWRRGGDGEHEAPKIIGEAIDTVCAELRRLTTLRPMGDAPDDEVVILIKHDDNRRVLGVCDQSESNVYVNGTYYAFQAFKGWLPLPTPSNAGE